MRQEGPFRTAANMTYDGDEIRQLLPVTDHMQIPIRQIVLGLLLAFNAMPAGARHKAADATKPVDPAASQTTTPIDLSLHTGSTSATIDLTPHPGSTSLSAT